MSKQIQKQKQQQSQPLTREQKATQIFQAANSMIERITDNEYRVRSQSRSGVIHDVYLLANFCTCEDHTNTQQKCKHIMAIELYRLEKIKKWLSAKMGVEV